MTTFPDVPETLTDGADEAEALREAQDALATALAGYVQARRVLPKPSAVLDRPLVPVPQGMAAKLAHH